MLIALKMLLLKVDGFLASKANKFERNSDQADNMCFRFFRKIRCRYKMGRGN